MENTSLFGLMQDKQLMISDFLAYAQEYHPDREIVSQTQRVECIGTPTGRPACGRGNWPAPLLPLESGPVTGLPHWQ